MIKIYSERKIISKCWGSHCKNKESSLTELPIKWFPGMLPESLQSLTKASRTYVTDTLNVLKGNEHTVYCI